MYVIDDVRINYVLLFQHITQHSFSQCLQCCTKLQNHTTNQCLPLLIMRVSQQELEAF